MEWAVQQVVDKCLPAGVDGWEQGAPSFGLLERVDPTPCRPICSQGSSLPGEEIHLSSDIFVGESSSLTSCVLKRAFAEFPRIFWFFYRCDRNIDKWPTLQVFFTPKNEFIQFAEPDLKDTWKDTQAGQKSTLVLSSLLAGSNPPLMGPAPSSCSSHGLAGVFSPFWEEGRFKMLQRKSINECFGQNLWSS